MEDCYASRHVSRECSFCRLTVRAVIDARGVTPIRAITGEKSGGADVPGIDVEYVDFLSVPDIVPVPSFRELRVPEATGVLE